VGQQLEEAEHQDRRQKNAYCQRCDPVAPRHVLRKLGRISDCAGSRNKAKGQLGANNYSWFDVHFALSCFLRAVRSCLPANSGRRLVIDAEQLVLRLKRKSPCQQSRVLIPGHSANRLKPVDNPGWRNRSKPGFRPDTRISLTSKLCVLKFEMSMTIFRSVP
jgi:hypothetical protein